MKGVLSVGIGGFFGALARYYISGPLNSGGWFPWGTLAVNLAGCFLLAFFLTVILEYLAGTSFLVLAVSTGFIGSFTTFSTLSAEAVNLVRISPSHTLIYYGVSLVFGLLLAFAGRYTAKMLTGTIKGKKLEGVEKVE